MKDLIKANNSVLFNFFIGIGKKISYMHSLSKMTIKIINGALLGENKSQDFWGELRFEMKYFNFHSY